MTKRPYRRGIVLPDVHAPFEDPPAIGSLIAYLSDEWWDEWVQLGDFLDLNCISGWNDAYPGNRKGQTLAEDAAYGKDLLRRLVAAARLKNPKCKCTLLEGNHEFRINKFIAKNPAFEGFDALEVPGLLGLEELKVTWVPYWRHKPNVHRIGDAQFAHGKYLNQYHAAKSANVFAGKVYYAHAHDVQELHAPLLEMGKTHMGKSLGCLCDLTQHWTTGDPNRWAHAFGVFWFYPDGTHQEVTVKPGAKGRFVGPTNGKVYGG